MFYKYFIFRNSKVGNSWIHFSLKRSCHSKIWTFSTKQPVKPPKVNTTAAAIQESKTTLQDVKTRDATIPSVITRLEMNTPGRTHNIPTETAWIHRSVSIHGCLSRTRSPACFPRRALMTRGWIQGGFLKMSYFVVKHGHLGAFLGQKTCFQEVFGSNHVFF